MAKKPTYEELEQRIKTLENDPIMADFTKHGFSGVIAKPYTMEKRGGVLREIFS